MTEIPKIFISYCWTNNHESRVINLAERLVSFCEIFRMVQIANINKKIADNSLPAIFITFKFIIILQQRALYFASSLDGKPKDLFR